MPLETDRTLKIMLVAGEASGDAHAAKLVNALRAESAGRDFEVIKTQWVTGDLLYFTSTMGLAGIS